MLYKLTVVHIVQTQAFLPETVIELTFGFQRINQ